MLAQPKVKAITGKALKMILAASSSTYENDGTEFACLLRAQEDTITEIILPPGTISSSRSAILRLHMMPIDFSVVGSAHSHPSPDATPSNEDLKFFSQTGWVHLIIGYPFNAGSWRAYSRDGRDVCLEVI